MDHMRVFEVVVGGRFRVCDVHLRIAMNRESGGRLVAAMFHHVGKCCARQQERSCALAS
jgi:hypothetical protein